MRWRKVFIRDIYRLEVEHFVHCVESAVCGQPFGGEYGSESEALAALGRMGERESVHGRVPCDGMYAGHFAFADGADGACAYLQGEGLGCTAGCVEFVDMGVSVMEGVYWG